MRLLPFVGLIVLAELADSDGKPFTFPAIVSDVHSDHCVSVVAFDAFVDGGFQASGTRTSTSLLYNEKGGTSTWRHTEQTMRLAALEQAVALLGKQVANLAEALAALNAKQPATQRLPVADNTPVLPAPAGEVIGKNTDGSPVIDSGSKAGPPSA